jgi:SAM-dependent methyltransferase
MISSSSKSPKKSLWDNFTGGHPLLKLLMDCLILEFRLLMKKQDRAVAFDLASMGELQFIQPVLLAFSERNPNDIIIIVHNGNTVDDFCRALPTLGKRAFHIQRQAFELFSFGKIDLFLTTEQYDLGLNGIYSVCMFHGHAGKGMSFVPEIVESFDAFFLLGPVHREAYNQFVSDWAEGCSPNHIELFEIGYPKSDKLLTNTYSRNSVLEDLGLNPVRKTVLYAPAFNEGASLREFGLELIELLGDLKIYNVIIKLPVDCWHPTTDYYATGGVDWFGEIGKLEKKYDNLVFYKEYHIDPVLACSDVLITCISTVSFEFYALNRPVIIIDTPKYFSRYLALRFPDKDTEAWAARNTANAGKEFALVVSHIRQIPDAIRTVLQNPNEFPRQQKRLKSYLLYNWGKGTVAAVSKLEELLGAAVRSKRPNKSKNISKLTAILVRKSAKILREIIDRILLRFGYRLREVGLGYLEAKTTAKAANNAGLSICEYLESKEADSRKKGRRDRIIDNMEKRNLFRLTHTVLEIGTGTGMYMEKILERFSPKRYEVYEPDRGWLKYLRKTYGDVGPCKMIYRIADGETLKPTKSSSCTLVHAHGVMIYLPFLKTFSYIRESARVLVPNGYLVFDCLLDTSLNQADIESWLHGPWRFPSIVPESLLMEFAEKCGLEKIDQFTEIIGSGTLVYLVFQKAGK